MNQEIQHIEQHEEEGISLVEILNVIKNNLILIIVMTLVFGLIAGGYAFGIAKPKYRSKAEVLLQIENNGGNVNSEALLAAQRLLGTAPGFIKSDHVLQQVINNLGLTNMKPIDLAKHLSASTSNASSDFIIKISYVSENKTLAQSIAQEVLNVIKNNEEVVSFKNAFFVLSPASDAVYDSPNKVLYILVGLVLGGVIGVVIAFGKLLFNTSYQTKEQLETGLGIQVIGVVPAYEVKESRKNEKI